jgi:hypothetical protein
MRFTSFFGLLALTSMVTAAPLEQVTNNFAAGPKLPAPKPGGPKPAPAPKPAPKPKPNRKVLYTFSKVSIISVREANTKDSQLCPLDVSSSQTSQAILAQVVTRKTFFVITTWTVLFLLASTRES